MRRSIVRIALNILTFSILGFFVPNFSAAQMGTRATILPLNGVDGECFGPDRKEYNRRVLSFRLGNPLIPEGDLRACFPTANVVLGPDNSDVKLIIGPTAEPRASFKVIQDTETYSVTIPLPDSRTDYVSGRALSYQNVKMILELEIDYGWAKLTACSLTFKQSLSDPTSVMDDDVDMGPVDKDISVPCQPIRSE